MTEVGLDGIGVERSGARDLPERERCSVQGVVAGSFGSEPDPVDLATQRCSGPPIERVGDRDRLVGDTALDSRWIDEAFEPVRQHCGGSPPLFHS